MKQVLTACANRSRRLTARGIRCHDGMREEVSTALVNADHQASVFTATILFILFLFFNFIAMFGVYF